MTQTMTRLALPKGRMQDAVLTLLADALKGAAALGVMGANQTDDADVVEFFRGVVAESERDSVYVSFSVTAGQIERLEQGEAFLQDLIP